eukprot:gene15325-18155_t
MVPLIAGSLARVVSATVTSPFELIRTNSQGIVKKNLHFVPMIRDIVNNVGVAGLWRGFSPTLIRDVPFSALYWAGYETFKMQSTFYINFVSGALSGSIAAILTTPIDVIKTRIQMTVQQPNSTTGPNANTATTSSSPIFHTRHIYRTEGWAGFTKGMVPRVAKISPACAIMVSTYEWVKSVKFD